MKINKRTILSIIIILMIFDSMLSLREVNAYTITAMVEDEYNNMSTELFVQGSSDNSVTNRYLTIEQFSKKVEKICGTNVLVDGEFDDLSEYITYADAAVLLNRADIALYGENNYDSELFQQVVLKKRVSGIKGCTKKQKKSIRMCFTKGIMIGNSNGICSQSRNITASTNLTKSDAAKYLKYLKNPSLRIKLTADGQVTRKTNLPSNYKKFPYILASFPNAFYECKLEYEYCNDTLTKGEDYIDPVDIRDTECYFGGTYGDVFNKYMDSYCEKIEENLKLRLSFDYRTVDNDWISNLRNTYIVYNDAQSDKTETDAISEYVEAAKKNKVILKCADVVVEPSTTHEFDRIYIRAYIKFKVMSCTNFYSADSNEQNNIIFGKYVYLNNLNKDKWYTAYVDIGISSSGYNDSGYGWGIKDDILCME